MSLPVFFLLFVQPPCFKLICFRDSERALPYRPRLPASFAKIQILKCDVKYYENFYISHVHMQPHTYTRKTPKHTQSSLCDNKSSLWNQKNRNKNLGRRKVFLFFLPLSFMGLSKLELWRYPLCEDRYAMALGCGLGNGLLSRNIGYSLSVRAIYL